MKILIIEDDKLLAKALNQVLTQNGFAVDSALSQEESLMKIDINDYDCLVLDINLPDGNGFDLLTTLRNKKNQTPIIIITARGQVEDRVKGLNLGADDYLPKPFDSQELIARIHALIRRNSQNTLPIIKIANLIIKPAQHTASINNHPLNLTAKEFAVLEYLARHNGQVVTRTMLMEHVWSSEFDSFSNVIDVYIRNLRRKMEQYSTQQFIKTIRGKGYILTEHA